MTRETEVALAAIDALCKKRKAKALRKLVLAAVESERTPMIFPDIYMGGATTTRIDVSGDAVATSQIDIADMGGSAGTHYTETYTAGVRT